MSATIGKALIRALAEGDSVRIGTQLRRLLADLNEDIAAGGASPSATDGITTIEAVSQFVLPTGSVDDQGDGVCSVQSVVWARKVLTDAEIKALPTTPVEIVPAPGEGKLLVLHGGVLGPMDGADYTNINAVASAKIAYGAVASEDASRAFSISPNILALADTALYYIEFGSKAAYDGNETRTQDGIDKGLFLYVDNAGDGDFTGGDPDNAFPVILAYSVIDLTP
jgi:hypothetical protein